MQTDGTCPECSGVLHEVSTIRLYMQHLVCGCCGKTYSRDARGRISLCPNPSGHIRTGTNEEAIMTHGKTKTQPRRAGRNLRKLQ
jgi:hypothetical protein